MACVLVLALFCQLCKVQYSLSSFRSKTVNALIWLPDKTGGIFVALFPEFLCNKNRN